MRICAHPNGYLLGHGITAADRYSSTALSFIPASWDSARKTSCKSLHCGKKIVSSALLLWFRYLEEKDEEERGGGEKKEKKKCKEKEEKKWKEKGKEMKKNKNKEKKKQSWVLGMKY